MTPPICYPELNRAISRKSRLPGGFFLVRRTHKCRVSAPPFVPTASAATPARVLATRPAFSIRRIMTRSRASAPTSTPAAAAAAPSLSADTIIALPTARATSTGAIPPSASHPARSIGPLVRQPETKAGLQAQLPSTAPGNCSYQQPPASASTRTTGKNRPRARQAHSFLRSMNKAMNPMPEAAASMMRHTLIVFETQL